MTTEEGSNICKVAGFENGGQGPWQVKEYRQSQDAGKDREAYSAQKLQKEMQTSQHPTTIEYTFFSSAMEHIFRTIKQTSTNLKELKTYKVYSLITMKSN